MKLRVVGKVGPTPVLLHYYIKALQKVQMNEVLRFTSINRLVVY